MLAGRPAQPLDLDEQLRDGFLLDVGGCIRFGGARGAEAEFVANDTFDHRTDMRGDQLREAGVGFFITRCKQKGSEQDVNVGQPLIHRSRECEVQC